MFPHNDKYIHPEVPMHIQSSLQDTTLRAHIVRHGHCGDILRGGGRLWLEGNAVFTEVVVDLGWACHLLSSSSLMEVVQQYFVWESPLASCLQAYPEVPR